MSSLHNDLATWAARAHLRGDRTIELTVRTAQDIAVRMAEMGQRIVDLEHQLRCECPTCRDEPYWRKQYYELLTEQSQRPTEEEFEHWMDAAFPRHKTTEDFSYASMLMAFRAGWGRERLASARREQARQAGETCTAPRKKITSRGFDRTRRKKMTDDGGHTA